MTNINTILWALLMLAGISPAAAAEPDDTLYLDNAELVFPEQYQRQRLIDDAKVIFTGDDSERPPVDSVNSLMMRYYLDQFRHFQDPKLPYFMFMSKDANLAMGIGAQVRMRGWYDWHRAVPANGFSPYMIPIPVDPAQRRQLKATPAGSGFHLVLLGRNTLAKTFMAYVEGNFDGYNHVDFKLKKAYVIINDWTVGYATSTFADPDAEPPTIDGAGPNGDISKTNVLLRYMHTFRQKWTVAASLEFPGSNPQTDGTLTKKCNDYLPDFAALGQYQWDGGESHVRLSGLLRFIPYRDLVDNTNHTVPGWGLQLSTCFKTLPDLSVFGLVNVGRGHSSYTGDLSIDAYDLVTRKDRPGRLYAPTSFAATLGLKYNFRPNVYSCLALAEQHYFPKDNPGDSQYKYGLYGAVNVFWEMSPRIMVGAEYLIGKRMNFDRTSGSANRIDALFQFSF